MEVQLSALLGAVLDEAESVEIDGFMALPGGFSRETFRFDASIQNGSTTTELPMILRKDPPAAVAILETSRLVEHNLLEALRANTGLPISRSYCAEMDPAVFGERAMIIERMPGNGQTSELFNDGPDADQVDDVIRHLCEVLVELHETSIDTIDPDHALRDPRAVGIDPSTWDSYMDTTFEYYISSYPEGEFDPFLLLYLDSFLSLRRTKPRAMPLSIVHGDFNPANFLYADSKVTALIDWENTRIGDPREDLGWMALMDVLSNTQVMAHPVDEGGFLAYYNKLRGLDITPEEIGYFTLFGTANIAVPVTAALARRVRKEHTEFLHLYVLQASSPGMMSFLSLLGYPGVPT
jgi:aminoglycoside phosphotransferase (APT) family kinase protein